MRISTYPRTYTRYWLEAHHELMTLQDYESPSDALAPKDRESAFSHLAQLYIRYLKTFQKLEEALDQILHPQKKRLLHQLVVSVAGRLHLVALEASDFIVLNQVLLDLKLTHQDLKVPVPRYIIDSKAVKERTTLLNNLNAREYEVGTSAFTPMTVLEAIKIIQKNERGRQGKLRARYMREMKAQGQEDAEEEKDVNAAALKIQKVARGYIARKKVEKLRRELEEFLGMRVAKNDSQVAQVKKNQARRKVLQQQFEDDYLNSLITTKEKIMKVEGPDMKEAMQDEFRQWYMDFKKQHGKFPAFPDAAVWKAPGFHFSQLDAANAAEKDSEADEDEASSAPTEKEKEKKKSESGGSQEIANPFKFNDSTILPEIVQKQTEFVQQWKNKDESNNFAQRHDQDIIKHDKRIEVEQEVKEQIFELLKDELANLKAVVSKDKKGKKGKGKKGKGKKGKKGKGKKGKKEKGKKGKKEKDLTANRTMEELVEELAQTGILQKYTPQPIETFKGEFDIMSSSISKEPIIMPSLGDLPRTMIEMCLLPMGANPEAIPKMSSCLLFGPKGSGKSHLIRSLATEIGAQIFNLSPKNTAGQYVGKANVTKMVHMVFKVARAQQPAIIVIENVEMVFAKKVPKDDTSDPKRIKKDLLKNLKSLKEPGDKVILIATSSKPWDGDVKAMLPMFDKCFYCPKPDYASRTRLWEDFISEKAPDHTVNISQLTRLSKGASAGSIRLICDRVMSDRRLKKTDKYPLKTQEFLDHLFTIPLENAEEDENFKSFFEKTPTLKKRAGMFSGEEAEAAEAKKDSKKKKK